MSMHTSLTGLSKWVTGCVSRHLCEMTLTWLWGSLQDLKCGFLESLLAGQVVFRGEVGSELNIYIWVLAREPKTGWNGLFSLSLPSSFPFFCFHFLSIPFVFLFSFPQCLSFLFLYFTCIFHFLFFSFPFTFLFLYFTLFCSSSFHFTFHSLAYFSLSFHSPFYFLLLILALRSPPFFSNKYAEGLSLILLVI